MSLPRYLGLLVLTIPLWSPGSTAALPAVLQGCTVCQTWIQPLPPFRIYGNTYYVGTKGISSILITSSAGDILIDGGMAESAPLVASNIRALGFQLHDIKLILSSEPRLDHAGGIADLQRLSGAQVMASEPAAVILAHGDSDDFEYGGQIPFPPVAKVRTFQDKGLIRLGPLEVRAYLTPGHIQGDTTYTWTSCEKHHCMHIAYVASLMTPDHLLVDNPKYPNEIADFHHSFAVISALPCDIMLVAHAQRYGLAQKLQALRKNPKHNPFIDPTACREYEKQARKQFELALPVQVQSRK